MGNNNNPCGVIKIDISLDVPGAGEVRVCAYVCEREIACVVCVCVCVSVCLSVCVSVCLSVQAASHAEGTARIHP